MKRSTRTTSRPKTASPETVSEKYGIQDWRNLSMPVAAPEPERSPEITQFFNGLWPVSESYASPLNPIFLLDLQKLSSFSEKESWLIRDGLLPLLWFFVNNPEPGRFKSTLRIHADFERFIPDAWRPQVELYELFPDENAPDPRQGAGNRVRELLLTGLIMPSACSLNRLECDLAEIVKFVGGKDKLPGIKIRAFLPARFEVTDRDNGPSFYNLFMKTLFQSLGLEIEFLEYESLRWMYASSQVWMHEFNEKLLYSDSILSLLCLSKGHRQIPMGPARKKPRFDRIYPVYPHVSCGIRKTYQENFVDYISSNWVPESQERAKAFYQATNSAANRLYPWPKWFPSWCQSLQAGSR